MDSAATDNPENLKVEPDDASDTGEEILRSK